MAISLAETKRKARKAENSLEGIREAFEKDGYLLLTREYRGYHGKYQYRCPEEHVGEVRWNNWKQGARCSQCAQIRNACKKRNSYSAVKQSFEEEGYQLLSAEYINNKQKLEFECSVGHRHSISYSDWQRGQRCAYCAGNARKNASDIDRMLQLQGYQLVSTTYERSSEKIMIQCPKGHRYQVRWNNFQQGNRCPKCVRVQSRGEIEMVNLFKMHTLVERDRTTIGPKELDLYFPNHKVAVEYCGLYWHGEVSPGDRITPNYHRQKMDQCQSQGIRLLTIFEDEWVNHRNICISRIHNALGICSNRIYARSCEARLIDKKEAKEFLNRTHLQGYGGCRVAFGLYYQDKLVQVMTFSSPARAHTAKGKKVLEMKRLAAELNTIVVGGAGKLFKLGLQYAKDNGYDTIKSYCDLRWGTGNLYKKMGFTKTYETKCTPHYTDGVNRYRNQSLSGSKQNSERNKVEQKGLWKIYDCGHQTWEYQVL